MHPYLIHFGHILLPTFAVLAALGLMSALTLGLRTARTVCLPPNKLWDAGLFMLLAAFLLSRLLLIAENLRSFLSYPVLLLTLPSLTASGLALTALATVVYLRRNRLPVLDTLDAWAPCATLFWAFLALGHLAEGSDAGLPTTPPWGILLPPDPIRLHPVPLYAAVAATLLTIALMAHLPRRALAGDTAALALAAAGTIQFILTFFRQPYPYVGSAWAVLDPIQWIGLGMIVTAGLLYLFPARKLVPRAV